MIEDNEMDDISFWAGLIERYTNQNITRGYFFSLRSYECIFQEKIHLPSEVKEVDENYRCDDHQINFLLAPLAKKAKIWNKVGVKQKYLFWLALENTDDSLSEEEKDEEISSLSFSPQRNLTQNRILDWASASGFDSPSEEEESSEEVEVKDLPLNKTQIELWKEVYNTDIDQASELWNRYLTWHQKIKLWNSLNYPPEVVAVFIRRTLKITQKVDPSIIKRQSIFGIEKFLKSLCLKADLFDSEENIYFNKDSQNSKAKVYRRLKELSDYKLYLFLMMEPEDQVRLWLHQKDKWEATIMTLLIIRSASV